ncbi:MAG: AraC family transcriptional regulator, partial [Bacteroidales bacterium]|nr:AraC family transcriptional regulator [Bacteroidales bacterium]
QMEEDRLFLKKGLSKDDLARAVYSNSRYISDCINRKAGCSFTDYVNDYRIRYARQLLYENPDMRLADISEESGFSSQVTFYRNFKARTGQTPGEWLNAQKDRPGE